VGLQIVEKKMALEELEKELEKIIKWLKGS
jgi:hypothetical protein